jgi:DNA-binding IclR family transcriptional regulator
MQILEFVGQNSGGYSFKQLSELLDFPNSSLWGLLKDLVELNYLSLDRNTKRYALGPQILVLASHYLANQDIVQIGRSFIHRAVELTNESSLLAVKYEDQILFAVRENCENNSIMSTARVGQRAPMYATPSGKAMLAYMTEDALDKYLKSVKLKQVTQKTIIDQKILQNELEVIRMGALAYSREEFRDGITAIGAPVFDMNGEAIAAIDVPVPTIRFNEEKEKKIEFILRGLADELSRQLGFDGIPKRFKNQH